MMNIGSYIYVYIYNIKFQVSSRFYLFISQIVIKSTFLENLLIQ